MNMEKEVVSLFTGMAGVKRIVTFLMSALSLLCAGSLFAFGSFSEDLRDKFGFSSKDINIVSALGNTAFATLYAQIYAIYYSSDTAGFLLFMTISVSLVNLIATFTMSTAPPPPRHQIMHADATKTTSSSNIGSNEAQATGTANPSTSVDSSDTLNNPSAGPSLVNQNIINDRPIPTIVDDPDAIVEYPARYPPIYCPAPPLNMSGRHSPTPSSRSRSPSVSSMSWRNRSRSRGRSATPSVYTFSLGSFKAADDDEDSQSLSKARSNISIFASGTMTTQEDDDGAVTRRRRGATFERATGGRSVKRTWREPRDEEDESARDTPLPTAFPKLDDSDAEDEASVVTPNESRSVTLPVAAMTTDVGEGKRVAFEEPDNNKGGEVRDSGVGKGEEMERDMTPAQILSYIWQQGITYFNNIGTIVKVLAGPGASTTDIAATTGFHVTLLSVSNCIARLTFGAGSDYVVSRLHVDRSSLFVVGEILTAIPLAIVGFANTLPPTLLGFSSVLTGFAFGAASALFPPLTADFFGLKHYGSACALVMVGIPIGIVVSNVIFGSMFDTAVSSGCTGTECYRSAFVVFLAIQILPVISAAVLFLRRSIGGRRGRVEVV
ncbi:hypothetical protein HDU67_009597 [Dinochytrium kinnereticum]|nr:hypothetical protein HDU67_009597 [Dinochytrium kinnereticum]